MERDRFRERLSVTVDAKVESAEHAMNAFLKSHPRLRRLASTIVLLVVLVAGLRAVHWAALRYVASRSPQLAFPEISLQTGIRMRDVLAQLGVPDARLHEVAVQNQGVTETLRYVRGECALELVFVDGKLASWSESQPLDLATLKHARRYVPQCCEPTGAATPQPEASVQRPD